jgi:hypothetical protein
MSRSPVDYLRRAHIQLVVFLLTGFLLFALIGASLGVSLTLASQRFDLFHASLFNACAMRSYDLHWQYPQRVPQGLSYDFVKSPDSFVLVEVWLNDGPTFSFSQRLPQNC